MLLGRDDACARVEDLLASVRHGRSEALVVLGPAGIGKTALLGYAFERAQGMQVLRARGDPAEVGIPYAGLSQLLSPLLDLLPSLSRPQAAAIAAALAIGPPAGKEAFPVYAATLSLLATAASQTPLLVLVDDGHWIDVASMDALLFAQRRLALDPVLLLLTFRLGPALPQPPAGLPSLELCGLDLESAAALLEQRGYSVDDELLPWLVRATGGNPLALRDLPTFISPADFASYALRSAPAPVGPALVAAYGQAVAVMPPDTRQAVLIAATLDGADMRVVARALQSAGLSVGALSPAEDAGLLEVASGSLTMRHPLVRAAVNQIAPPSARRAAHLAAADGLQASNRPHHREARIWHLAEAAVGVDEPTAALLEELAEAATARAGYVPACLTFQKAAELSGDVQGRVRRLLAAAAAAFTAGLPAKSVELLDRADEEVVNLPDAVAATSEHLRGRIETWSGDPLAATRRLELAAKRTRHIDPAMSIALSADATVAAMLSGQMQRASETARLVADIAVELGSPAPPLGELLVGAVQTLRGDGDSARPLLDRCRRVIDVAEPSVELLQQLIYLATAYSFIDGFQEAIPLFTRAIAMARRQGAIGKLPFALTMAAVLDFRIGAWGPAYARASEALSLAEDSGRTTDRPNTLVVLAMIEAGRGCEQARPTALAAINEASAMGARTIEAEGYSMLGLLELGTGRPAAAVAPLRRCGQLATDLGILELGHLQWAAELVEAQVRSGTWTSDDQTLRTMKDAVHGGATALNRALLARCEGLVATDDSWEERFDAALALHAGSQGRPFELARTELCFGERLRRQRRRKDARAHLAAAWESFSRLGAPTWAQRAAHELEATGTTRPGPTTHVSDLLTPQELQVALAVAAGATNREVAGTLFLSQKTIEFHLSSIYRRLGLRSRTELTRLLQDRQDQPAL